VVQRLAYLGQLLGISSLTFLDTLLEVELNLAQRLQSRDEVVVEDAKVCVWLSFGLATFLLRSQSDASQGPRNGERTGVLSTPRILSMY
jgi:hypothetical protein